MRLALRTALLALVALLALPAGTMAQSRIISGSAATVGQFPYQVAIHIDFGGSEPGLCGGSIINGGTQVATAAHCVVDDFSAAYPFVMAPADFTVLHGGTDRLNQGGPGDNMESVGVTRVQVDRRYQRRLGAQEFDSAVLTLDTDIVPSPDTGEIPLATADEVTEAFGAQGDNRPIVSGWGEIDNDDETDTTPAELQWVRVPLASNATCQNGYGPDVFFPSAMLCAGTVGTNQPDACQGDSGGPLAIDLNDDPNIFVPALAGITSFGAECGRFPGVYTRVTETFTNSFLSNPTTLDPPDPAGFASISGTLRVGERVTCTPPSVPGSNVTQYLWYLFHPNFGFSLLSTAGPTVVLPAGAAGLRIVCDTRHENNGGFGYSLMPASAAVGPIAALPSGPGGSPGDTQRPRVRIRRIRCNLRRRCRITVSARDADGVVSRVRGTLRYRRGGKLRKKTFRLRRSRGLYTRTLKLRRGRYRLSVAARDRAGHLSRRASRRFRVR